MSYSPRRVQPKQMEVLRLAVAGWSAVKIADQLGLSVVTIGNIINSPLGQGIIASLQQRRNELVVDLDKEVSECAASAMNLVKDAVAGRLGGLKPEDRVRTALTMLAAAGHGPVKRADVHQRTEIIDAEFLRALDERAARDEVIVSVNS